MRIKIIAALVPASVSEGYAKFYILMLGTQQCLLKLYMIFRKFSRAKTNPNKMTSCGSNNLHIFVKLIDYFICFK